VCNAKIPSKSFETRCNILIALREMVVEEELEPPTRGL